MTTIPDDIESEAGETAASDVALAESPPPRGSALLTSDSGSDGEDEVKSNPAGLLILFGLLGYLWFAAGFKTLLFVLALVMMIFLHELGHFMTARWTGMKATQFFIGMGPKLWSFRRGETEYGVRAIPAGAFVRIIGMNNLDPVPAEDEPRTYRQASFPRRMLVITAGSLMHFIQAFLVIMIAFSVVGDEDRSGPWEIGTLATLNDGSEAPSVGAGLQPGDVLVEVDGQSFQFADLAGYLQPKPGEDVDLLVERTTDGVTERFETTVTLASQPQDDGTVTGFLGVGANYQDRVTVSPAEAVIIYGESMYETTKQLTILFDPGTYTRLGSLLGSGSEDVNINSDEAQNRPVSLVGVVRIAGDERFNWFEPLVIFATINMFVGVFNLVPLLPLDGGHAAIGIYERIRSRGGRRHHADVAKLLGPTYVVVAVLGFLFVSTLWLDIFRPISG